ncbi:MAG: hypothetical protein HGA37_00070 [Lentimicrobium sp.]|nr:hypothetical protein [Lentimicrobium sp.]
MNQPLYAVITGDIKKSTRLPAADLARLPSVLKNIFNQFGKMPEPKGKLLRHSIFRGDSFQLVLEPESALEAMLFIRAGLRAAYPGTVAKAVDCRLAAAIGSIDNLTDNITESTGEAFTLSGHLMEDMKKTFLMAIITPNPAATSELNTELALCDRIITRWTYAQAQLLPKLLNAEVQAKIADDLGISQAAVAKMLQVMGWQAIEMLLLRYQHLCQNSFRDINNPQ